VEQPRPRRTGGNVVEDKRLKKPLPVPDDADVEVEATEDAEEDVLEDTSDLEDDSDPLGADIEVEPDTDEPER
jgi:hypothetical protein